MFTMKNGVEDRRFRMRLSRRSSNYHLFLKLKEHLGGKRFKSDDEVRAEVTRFLNGLAGDFFEYKSWSTVFKSVSKKMETMLKNRQQCPTHCDDLMYIFHHKYTPDVEKNTKEDIGIERFVKLWTNFAKTSNPIEPVHEVLKGVDWKPVDPGRFHYLDIGLDLVPGIEPDQERMSFWDEIFSMNPENLRY